MDVISYERATDVSAVIKAAQQPGVAFIGGGLRIGALVHNSDAANHTWIRERYPLLSQAFLAGASAQLRNMATVGGNLMQRTRSLLLLL